MNWITDKNDHGKGSVALAVFMAMTLALLLSLFPFNPQSTASTPTLLSGQSVTVLPDSRWLLLGGEGFNGPVSTVSVWDPRTGVTTQLNVQLQTARAWHTATMLPDGTVLVFGGIGSAGQVLSSFELFDPSLLSVIALHQSVALSPRARHSATLLTEGSVLLAGGVDLSGETLSTAELWGAFDGVMVRVYSLTTARRGHTATLTAQGTVLLTGGLAEDGSLLDSGDLFDPMIQAFSLFDAETLQNQLPPGSPILMSSIPANNATDVALDAIISLRFSKPLRAETVNSQTVTLSGPRGIEDVKVIPAEGGILAFITPHMELLSGATYSVTVNGAVDYDGLLLPVSGISFTTKPAEISSQPSGESNAESSNFEPASPSFQPSTISSQQSDDWEWKGGLRNGKPHSDWQDLPPLQAHPGATALAGQVLDLRGLPLVHVTLKITSEYGDKERSAQTDETGRFLLSYIDGGWSELIIDGRRARRRVNPESSALGPEEDHGIFKYGIEIKPSETSVLPFTIWLPKIDTAHAVKIASPTISEVVVTTPRIRGLELRIPAETVIYDYEGGVVTEVGLTPIPLDRTPFPLPKDVEVPIYFTAQPGGAYLNSVENSGARIYYPNNFNHLPGTRFEFWHYDPGYRGWYVYGLGTVQEDGKQVIPDPGISVSRFTGAMVSFPGSAPAEGPRCLFIFICSDGDPVNLDTGLFILQTTDLYLPDIIPVSLNRTYRPRDTVSRPFGIGATHPYEMFLVGSTNPYTYVELILPDGARIHYGRISPGTGFSDAVYENTSSPTEFFRSTVSWNGNGWNLKLKDGTIYVFGDNAPLQQIRDRAGNQLTIYRANGQTGNITKVLSPNGRWIEFSYGVGNRITQAKDNIARTVNYEYDGTGRLIRVTDPGGGVTEYTYDSSSRMLTIKDARNIVFLTNEYDSTGKVMKQTQADGGTYEFAYITDGNGKVTQIDVTGPRGDLRRVSFNAGGQILTDTRALGTPEEQLKTYARETASNLVLSATDALNRTTEYTYDEMGNVTSITSLAGTPDAVTTTYIYEPQFNRVASMTDPLNHTTTYGYDANGNVVTVTNALNETITVGRNSAGQPVSITDASGNTTQFSYEFGDLVAITDPAGNVRTRLADAAGRVLRVTDPLGHSSNFDYDALNRLSQVSDPLNGLTQFGYDPNGNLLSVTNARNNITAYTCDEMDRLATRTDPLLRSESYHYDHGGNLTQFANRNNQATAYGYDSLNRRRSITYADGSTTIYTYDAGNRLINVQDSIAGTITRTYDGLDRMTSETTPQGAVIYTYDAAGRRTSMTVTGQPTVSYLYDDANRLIQITQATSIVIYTYDTAGRRTSVTLPNGVLVKYAYDAASRITGITYKQNGTTLLGDLTYEYDKAGNRTKIGGSFARTGIPQSITSADYNAANQQIAFGDKSLTYDNNGNLLNITDSNGTTINSWNARTQLVGISGPSIDASFVYDGLGRRQKKTINGELTEFLYDGLNPVQESSGSAVLANVLPSLRIDEFLARADLATGVTSTFLSDVLGSTLALTDPDGTMQTEYTYEPFGRTTAMGVSNTNAFQYTSRENDGTGLYYYRARYYDPSLQRFISEDPLNLATIHVNAGDEGRSLVAYAFLTEGTVGGNPYVYVDNNSVNITDPSGLIGLREAAGLGAGLGIATGVMGARKPFMAAGFGALFGVTYSPLIAAVPLFGPVGAVTGFVVGFSTGMAVASIGSGGRDTTGAIVAGLAGGLGGAAGGYIGGTRGAIIAAGFTTTVVMGYSIVAH